MEAEPKVEVSSKALKIVYKNLERYFYLYNQQHKTFTTHCLFIDYILTHRLNLLSSNLRNVKI